MGYDFTPFDNFNILLCCCFLPQLMQLLGLNESVHALFTDVFGSFDDMSGVVITWGSHGAFFPGASGGGLMKPDSIIHQTKAMWLLCCPLDSSIAGEAKRFLS